MPKKRIKMHEVDENLINDEELQDFENKLNLDRAKRTRIKETELALKEIENRARSVSIGTAFGGTVDISLRRPDGQVTYAVLQPVEAIEVLHQLAASVGCHLHLQPREDFGSWRKWKDKDATDLRSYYGARIAPSPEYDEDERTTKATQLPPVREQVGVNPDMMVKEQEDAVATEKTVDKRKLNGSRKTA